MLTLLVILGLVPFPDDYFPGLLCQITDYFLTRQTARLCGGGSLDWDTMMSWYLGGLWEGSSLARGYIPAQKHCELFYILVADVLGYATRFGMLLSPGPGQFFGSYVVNRVLAIRLVQ